MVKGIIVGAYFPFYGSELTISLDLMTTTWNNLQITRATTIGGLKTATPKVIYTDSNSSRCCNVWAPEIHYMPNEGAWFV
jgi:GH43 family beta-xylosidase